MREKAPPKAGQLNFRAWSGNPNSSSQTTDSIPVTQSSEQGVTIAKMAEKMQPEVCKDPSDGNCQKHVRETVQAAFPNAFAGVWDRSKDASALTNLKSFQKHKLAYPYRPGMPIPAGSILYSTTLNKDYGHAAIAGTQGQILDQYGSNHFAPSSFDWYVPPPGTNTPRQSANAPPSLPPMGASSKPSTVNYHTMSTGELLQRLASKYK